MKLLYITNGINGSGGLERGLSVKASKLAEDLGYDVYILGLNNGNDNPFYTFSTKINFLNIDIIGNPISYVFQYKKKIKAIIDQIEPDIISVCDDGLKGFFIPKFIKIDGKIIYERHALVLLNTNDSIKGRISRKIMRYLGKGFDKFIVLTKGNLKEWSGNNLAVIPNPLSFTINESSLLDSKKVIAVGSHSKVKGYDLLLEVWKEIEAKYPDWQLDIYGKIDDAQTYIKQASNAKLKKVNFHNPVTEISKAYLSSSLMVLTSRSEGFGMVLIEAMECGLPCVSFDCPHGPADIIENGVDGYLVDNGNLDEFKIKLESLIENESLRKQMGEMAKRNVKQYLPENIMNVWHLLFQNLLN